MPSFPQYQNADLVTYSTYRTLVLAGSAGGAITANAGDVILVEVNAVNVSGTGTVTLPQVAHGGPVLVKFTHTSVATNFGSAAVVQVVPPAADITAGVKIDGGNSIKLNNIGDILVLCSDGSNWWVIDKAHNTVDTY